MKVLLSSEYFSVDGRLLNAWASSKSFRLKDGSGPPHETGHNGAQNFHSQKSSNVTHASTTAPMQGFTASNAPRKPNWPSWGMR
ncbi:MAG: hypothetical protein INF72_14110 [Roseomonas sp.]|nr:hypothetical protein [Roseomonas sp.]MCA3455808.1 hypothetical protein [Rhodobacter sp.]MCA3346147.1 hypothetical protein [Roseomonas sp.]MCA3362621.1 hypothetical protein [Roseomonas sp.]MCA3372351.1 hypothetical protein [Roseomonas sp.]